MSGRGLPIGMRSTFQVKCIVCGATYGNAASHECEWTGVKLRNRILALEARLEVLENKSEGKK